MNTVRQLKGLITEGKKLFAYDDNGAKVTWNAEDGGWEDVCGDCNKSWCEGGEYDENNQWFCVDCYVTPSDSEDEDEEELVVPKKEYWFDNNVWFIIKDFAGIYDLQINWSRRWNNPKTHSLLYRINYNMFKSITQKAYYTLSEDVIRKKVFNTLTNVEKKECYERLEMLYPLFSVPTWITVGTEVEWTAPRWSGDFNIVAGKVTKITDKSISISVYECQKVRVIDPTGKMCYTCKKWTTKIASKITNTTNKNYKPKTEYWDKSQVLEYDDNIKAMDLLMQKIENRK